MKLKLIIKNGKPEVQNAKTGEVLKNVANIDYTEYLHNVPRMTLEILNVPKVVVIDTPYESENKIVAIDHAWRS